MVRAGLILALAAVSAAAPAQEHKPFDPVAFFTGATSGRGELKELVGKPRKTATHSVGRVDKDGWLILDQRVAVEGDPVRQRRWRLKQVKPGHYSGTISDSTDKVEAEVAGSTIRIRYRMKGGIKVEQLLTALPGGRSISNRSTFRKFGMKVATLTERIEKR